MTDSELESMLLSKVSAKTSEPGSLPIEHEGADHLALYKDIPVPSKEDLATPEAAQQWAQQELVKANPRAAQEFINQLRRGNSKERMEAAKEIFNRTGLHPGQTKVTNNATVVVLTADAVKNLPWAAKFVEKKNKQLADSEPAEFESITRNPNKADD